MMKIATYNANSIRSRLHIVKPWLERQRPDVLAVQETKVVDSDFPLGEFESLGYHCAFRGEKSYNGVAVFSRIPIERIHYGFDGAGADEGSRFLLVWIHGIPILNTYVPQGTDPESDKFQYKLAWFDRLLSFFKTSFKPDAPLIWLGDFNVAPEPIDVHDPKRLLGHVGYHPDEHRALAKVKAWGFIDVFRKHVPDAGQFTFYDYRAKGGVERGLGWRVDHLWATAPAAEKSLRAWIDLEPRRQEKPSDHTFLAAEFDL